MLIDLPHHVRNFDLIESIDDHSAAVTSVKLACNGSKMLSCSADRYFGLCILLRPEDRKCELLESLRK